MTGHVPTTITIPGTPRRVAQKATQNHPRQSIHSLSCPRWQYPRYPKHQMAETKDRRRYLPRISAAPSSFLSLQSLPCLLYAHVPGTIGRELNFSPNSSMQQPEPSSINSIIREHNRSRLYVRPLHWTSQHLQLLGCRFVLKKATRRQSERPCPEKDAGQTGRACRPRRPFV
ncbi:hypothetical protein F5B18DRAFT_139175 [Nemania serpens]|nr:hypothetical protein F5B18DRAFT_139175 [Nemania serpens]